MPDPDKLLTMLYRVADAVRQTPGRRGRFVELRDIDELIVAGDMHGHIGNFQAIYKIADLAKNPRRHLVLQEVIHGTFHYPTGGDKSHQLLDLFSALKCQFPKQVHLLMGNHELSQWTNRPVMKNDADLNTLFMEGVNTAYGPEKGPGIYAGYMRLFGVLPLALRTSNRIFISHSLPRPKHLDRFDLRHLETDSFPAEDLTVGGSVYELLWGRDTKADHSRAFLNKVSADWLVSGHIAFETGYSFPSEHHLIVDCCDAPAAYAHLPTVVSLTTDTFRSSLRMLHAE
ncbi:metallophosphoesterase [Zavarzinella formosa]|uniref:metallophosphoesterase n=1 Tax=Zavarzinella formosa TaxID=360055 RepID=UPI0002ED1747|nr:metallophosphoesterase [Zavarzinella formosa]